MLKEFANSERPLERLSVSVKPPEKFNIYSMIKYKYALLMTIASLLLQSCDGNTSVVRKDEPTILIHYMSWYGDANAGNDSLRHWKFGHANTPLIGRYDSHSKAALYYHLLLAWSAGIDGIVINVKDAYDWKGLALVRQAIEELDVITQKGFDFKFAISFDDQGFDLEAPLDTAAAKIKRFKTELVDHNDYYLKHNGKPIIYSFDYPNKFLTAKSLSATLDTVFGENGAYLIWNTFGEGENTQDYVDAFYPWVQPGGPWDPEGNNWGKPYLDYFYPQVNNFQDQNYEFVGGGVWPGFDDRKNTSWGGQRLISRGGGSTYDSTWHYIQNYRGEIPMKYIMIETWNDWNEGTEIEPSVENGFQNMVQTNDQINTLKGHKRSSDESKFEVAVDIYQLLNAYENGSVKNKEAIDQVISLFINEEYAASKKLASEVFTK